MQLDASDAERARVLEEWMTEQPLALRKLDRSDRRVAHLGGTEEVGTVARNRLWHTPVQAGGEKNFDRAPGTAQPSIHDQNRKKQKLLDRYGSWDARRVVSFSRIVRRR